MKLPTYNCPTCNSECTQTHSDIDLWLITIPGIDPESPRAAYYVKWWNVQAKINYAKANGEWPPKSANDMRY